MVTTIRYMNKIVSNSHKYIISRDTKWYTYQFDHIIDDYMIGFDIYHQTVVYMINLITGMQNWELKATNWELESEISQWS